MLEQLATMRKALEDARHDLSFVTGLYATDRFEKYALAQEAGADANGAWDAFCECVFVLDMKDTIAKIDAALEQGAIVIQAVTDPENQPNQFGATQ